MWLFIRDFTFPKIIFLAIYFLSGCSTKQGRLIKEKGFLKPAMKHAGTSAFSNQIRTVTAYVKLIELPAVKMKSALIVFHYHCKPQIWVLSPTLIKTAEKKHLIPEKNKFRKKKTHNDMRLYGPALR